MRNIQKKKEQAKQILSNIALYLFYQNKGDKMLTIEEAKKIAEMVKDKEEFVTAKTVQKLREITKPYTLRDPKYIFPIEQDLVEASYNRDLIVVAMFNMHPDLKAQIHELEIEEDY